MASLYARGWRQGSLFTADLPLDAVLLGAGGKPEGVHGFHGKWVVASQNCDLDMVEEDDLKPTIEVRPVYTEDAPADWGIRSSKLLLTEAEYVESARPRTHAAPAVLTTLLRDGIDRRDPGPARRLAFMTWLGLRYDRPAVPPDLVPLARRVATEVSRRRHREIGRRVRDVLMQFDASVTPVRYSLYAVLVDATDRDEVREWLAAAAQAVPAELGVADVIEAAAASGISFELVETSYSADVSQLTWRASEPEPDGAT